MANLREFPQGVPEIGLLCSQERDVKFTPRTFIGHLVLAIPFVRINIGQFTIATSVSFYHLPIHLIILVYFVDMTSCLNCKVKG